MKYWELESNCSKIATWMEDDLECSRSELVTSFWAIRQFWSMCASCSVVAIAWEYSNDMSKSQWSDFLSAFHRLRTWRWYKFENFYRLWDLSLHVCAEHCCRSAWVLGSNDGHATFWMWRLDSCEAIWNWMMIRDQGMSDWKGWGAYFWIDGPERALSLAGCCAHEYPVIELVYIWLDIIYYISWWVTVRSKREARYHCKKLRLHDWWISYEIRIRKDVWKQVHKLGSNKTLSAKIWYPLRSDIPQET